jgi:hypothetical protein
LHVFRVSHIIMSFLPWYGRFRLVTLRVQVLEENRIGALHSETNMI